MEKMKKNFYRVLSAVLTVAIISGEFSGMALGANAAEQIDEQNEVFVEEMTSFADVELPEEDILFEGYANRFFMKMKMHQYLV